MGWFSSGPDGEFGGNWFRGQNRENDCKLYLQGLDKESNRMNLKVKKVTRIDKKEEIEIRIEYERLKK